MPYEQDKNLEFGAGILEEILISSLVLQSVRSMMCLESVLNVDNLGSFSRKTKDCATSAEG
jgi:hypothetical protein